jgi:hypothetical protein
VRCHMKALLSSAGSTLSWGGAIALAALAVSLVLAPIASADPKVIVDEIGSPAVGESGGLFDSPRGAAVNQAGAGGVPAGTFYVVDSENRRLQRFGPIGDFVSTWGWGVMDGSDRFQICTEAECRKGRAGSDAGQFGFRGAEGVAVDQSNGNVYVSDPAAGNRRIHIFGAAGDFQGAFGWGTINSTPAFQFCTVATGCAPTNTGSGGDGGQFGTAIGGLAVDATGDLYVANTTFRRVDVFRPTLTGGTVTGVEFVRAFGRDVVATGTPNNISTTAFEVCDTTKGNIATDCKGGTAGAEAGNFATGSPSDVAVDVEGNVFALDVDNNRVQKFDSTPEPINASFGSGALEALFGSEPQLANIAIDPSATPNHVLVSGNRPASDGRIAIVELDGSGNNALGAGESHGEELPATSANGLAVAKAAIGGNLYLPTETTAVLQGVYVLNEVPTIEPVTGITGTSATFKGNLVSNGLDVTYHFEYSTDGRSWTKVPASDVSLPGELGTISVEVEADDLTGSQPYRVRLVQNRPLGGGVATSTETNFETLPEKPAIRGGVASPVKDTSATFSAYLNPQNEATTYRFEYGRADCSVNPCTALSFSEASGGGLRLITQTASGLEPATIYHFRLIANNATGMIVGPDRIFQTFDSGARLPDNRAYELVTPPDTAGVVLAGSFGADGVACFDMFSASAHGDSVVSMGRGGSVPGLDVNGRWDLYQSVRDPEDGWRTVAKSASGTQSTNGTTGLCTSPDHLYSTFGTAEAPGDQGSLVIEGKRSRYIREPNGTYSLVGQGSLGTDPEADPRWITDKAAHIVFTSRVQLEPGAPSSGTEAVYDRTPGGPTHVVSLLPGELTPEAGQNAEYQGSSVDGSTVAFRVPADGTLYARVDNTTTIAAPDALVGESLACTGGPTSGAGEPALSYQWLRNGAAIGGATSPDYTIQGLDAGTLLQCQVVATNTVEDAQGGFAGSIEVSEPAIAVEPVPATAPPVPTSRPVTVTGPALTVQEDGTGGGQILTCNARESEWTGSPTFTYKWYRNGVPAPGAESATYETTAEDLTARAAFQCGAIGTNAGGSVTKLSRNRTTSPSPSPAAPTASAATPSTVKSFAGISDNGDHLFYVQGDDRGQGGNVFDLDTSTQTASRLVGSGDVQLVNVSGDGSHVYFISKSALTGGEENDQGQEAESGQNNLYVWDRASEETHFIAIVAAEDVTGGQSLTNWTSHAVSPNANSQNGRANATSRTIPNGSVLLFESRANVTSYDSGGHNQIYRYGAADGGLDCVSCPPTGLPATSDARLHVLIAGTSLDPASSIVHIQNVTDDGQKVFFQTEDALVPGDVNETWDVYEWKLGQQPYLLSSGKGQLPSFLYGMAPSGSDVFFTTTERLVPQDVSTILSIYDAREGGGFPAAKAEQPCLPDSGCQDAPSAAPAVVRAGSSTLTGPENLRTRACLGAARQAKRQSTRAKRARRNGRRLAVAGRRGRAKGLQRRAQRLAKRAKRSSVRAKRCRAGGRTNTNRGADR